MRLVGLKRFLRVHSLLFCTKIKIIDDLVCFLVFWTFGVKIAIRTGTAETLREKRFYDRGNLSLSSEFHRSSSCVLSLR